MKDPSKYPRVRKRGMQMTKEEPFSETFKLDKETKNTVRYAEEAEGRRPVVGTVYVHKYELPKPFPKGIRVTVEPLE